MEEKCLGTGQSNNIQDQVVTQLFRELSKNWAKLAYLHIERVANLCKAKASAMILDGSTKYKESVSRNVVEGWIEPYLHAAVSKYNARIDRLERDTFTTLSLYNPLLESLRKEKTQELYSIEGKGSSGRRATDITNLMHALAYYDVEVGYWITAVIKQAAEPFVRSLPQALYAELILDLSDERVKATMAEPAHVSTKRMKLLDTVEKLNYALEKLDEQIETLE